MNGNILQDLTIIIPTFNRPEHFSRLMRYYAKTNETLSFIVLDSSHPETIEKNRECCKNTKHNIKYLTYPETTPVIHKLKNGTKEIDTPFSVFCADDDILFTSSLSQALDFLRKNPAYVCADGIYLNFHRQENDIHIHIEYSVLGYDSHHPCLRIFKLCQNYASLFYSVTRTPCLQTVFDKIDSNPSNTYQELFQSGATLLFGKHHRLPIFYAGRHACAPAEPERTNWNSHQWFAENPKEYLEHFLLYRDNLWKLYQNETQDPLFTKELFERSMDLAFSIFMAKGCAEVGFHSIVHKDLWPDESFQSINENDACHLLKQQYKKKLKVTKIFTRLTNLTESIIKKYSFNRFNQKIQQQTKKNWQCAIPSNLAWLTDVEDFNTAYFEICNYFNE
jgi:glycosyltransferase domain-containing protein